MASGCARNGQHAMWEEEKNKKKKATQDLPPPKKNEKRNTCCRENKFSILLGCAGVRGLLCFSFTFTLSMTSESDALPGESVSRMA